MTALTLLSLGMVAVFSLPVSLLPDVPVPEIIIQADYPSADASQIEKLIATPLRNQLVQINSLDDLVASSTDGLVTIKIRFDYGTNIDLAYFEVGERLDIAMETLPQDLSRPRIMKTSAGDIPVFQLNVWAKDEPSNFIELSYLSEHVLKRRLEQMDDIAFVDLTGLTRSQVVINPNLDALRNSGVSVSDFSRLFKTQSRHLGNVVINEGHNELSVTIDASLKSVDEIENLYLRLGTLGQRMARIKDLAEVHLKEAVATGYYTYNGKRAVGFAIVKRSDAQLLELRAQMGDLVSKLSKQYPRLGFSLSEDQTQLLDLSIGNLVSSLTVGAFLSFVMLLLFIRDIRTLILIGVVIPVSLSTTFVGFYLLNISINIVSLAGLVLGIGEIVDSAIIIIESIEQHEEESTQANHTLAESCTIGAESVIRPLFTSVLTNSIVFLPLLLMSGIAGAIFLDQAIAVSLALLISLFTSYTIIPVLYLQLFMNRKRSRQITSAQKVVTQLYTTTFDLAINRPVLTIFTWAMMLLITGIILTTITTAGMPKISHDQLTAYINWNENISVPENNKRIEGIIKTANIEMPERGCYVGQQQFLLSNRVQQSSMESMMVFKLKTDSDFTVLAEHIRQYLASHYRHANFEIRAGENVFEQLFQTSDRPLRILLSSRNTSTTPALAEVDSIVRMLRAYNINLQMPSRVQRLYLKIDNSRLLKYNVNRDDLIQAIRVQLNNEKVGTLFLNQEQVPILLSSHAASPTFEDVLSRAFVETAQGNFLPCSKLLDYELGLDYATLTLGKNGTFVQLLPESNSIDVKEYIATLKSFFGMNKSYNILLDGSYFRNTSYIKEIIGSFAIAVGILFFLLAAQFESIQQPIIVLMTVIFGVAGGIMSLFLAGNSLNIMSAIGMIILVGLLDNDSILKIDSMNRARNKHTLIETIRIGGQKRLQSQIITFLTTILGLLPILWSAGLGAELQRPLAVTVVGGMVVGLYISWTFIPLTYYWIARYSKASRLQE